MLVVGHSEDGMYPMLRAETASPCAAGLALVEPQDERLLDLLALQLDESLDRQYRRRDHRRHRRLDGRSRLRRSADRGARHSTRTRTDRLLPAARGPRHITGSDPSSPSALPRPLTDSGQ